MQPESDMLVALLPQWLTSTLSQPPYFWNIDAVTIEADSVEIRGWALPWRGLPFNRVLRCADGHLMSITNTPDTAMAAHFPYWPNAATAPLIGACCIDPERCQLRRHRKRRSCEHFTTRAAPRPVLALALRTNVDLPRRAPGEPHIARRRIHAGLLLGLRMHPLQRIQG